MDVSAEREAFFFPQGERQMAKKKWYVVWKGKKPGIYSTWAECEKQVKGFKGARFKSFSSYEEAETAFNNSAAKPEAENGSYITESISVDAGSHGNPGPVEYRGVYTKTEEIVFAHPGFKKGTNNIAEFLGIVHALRYLKDKESGMPVYSDSATAIGWVEKKKANSTLVEDADSREIWEEIRRAENWLREHTWDNPIYKWDTNNWGEIKADYQRK